MGVLATSWRRTSSNPGFGQEERKRRRPEPSRVGAIGSRPGLGRYRSWFATKRVELHVVYLIDLLVRRRGDVPGKEQGTNEGGRKDRWCPSRRSDQDLAVGFSRCDERSTARVADHRSPGRRHRQIRRVLDVLTGLRQQLVRAKRFEEASARTRSDLVGLLEA